MKLGIFGGSFDPVHFGHLLLAECCREQCGLDQLWLMPAAQPPHKPESRLAAPEHRLAMLELAAGGHESLRVSTLELDRGGTSYTIDTLRQIHVQHPEAELYLLLGGDSLPEIVTWREPAAICEMALPVVVRRPGAPEPDFSPLRSLVAPERLARIEQLVVEMPQMDLSSSEIRRRVAGGQSIRYRTPRAVEQYILEKGLYR